MEAWEIIKIFLEWIIAPVAMFVVFIYRQQQQHSTEIAVLKANTGSLKEAHERELKAIQDTTRAIMSKLDNIEQALRK